MKTPRVSVIVPVLNAGAYLGEAIESIMSQSFQDWELIIVDDGSTDDSPAVAQSYREKDARIVLLPPDKDRRGAAAARNRGIAASRGEFITFLDADDLYLPAKLAHDIAALDADPEAGWVYSASRRFHQDAPDRYRSEMLGLRLDRRYQPPELLCRIILEERGDVPATCGVMIRRKALEEVGGFEERFALYEDQSLWVKLMMRYPVRVISGCNASYRQHAGSTSTAAAASGLYHRYKAHPARDAFLEWVGDYAAANHAPASVMKSLAISKSANDGRLLTRWKRKLRCMNRHLYRR